MQVLTGILSEKTEKDIGTQVSDYLNSLDDSYIPLLFTPLGYPNAEPVGNGRKSVEELVKFI